MKVVLELQGQYSNIRRVTVRHDIVIGRGTDCNLRVSAPQVSRRHCFLRIETDGVSITDLDSCNGTWLNGQKTVPSKRYSLEDGMKLAVGPILFIAHLSGDDSEMISSEDSVTEMPVEHNAALSPNAVGVESMDFAIEHAGASAEDDDPTADYSKNSASAAVASSGIEIIGDESEEVILLDEATEVVDGAVSVEAIELVVEAELIDDDEVVLEAELVEDEDIEELFAVEEIPEDDDNDALSDFLDG